MVEISAIPEEAKQGIEQLGTVDLVIGCLDQKAVENVAGTVDAIRQGLSMVSNFGSAAVVLRRDSAETNSGGFQEGLENESLRLATFSLPSLDASVTGAANIARAYRAIWNVSARLGARACVVIASSVDTLTPQWIQALLQPVLENDSDLVAPCYAQHKFEGLLNTAILYPLTRAVYGKRILNPLGPDFGLSTRLFATLFQVDSSRLKSAGAGQFVPIGAEATAKGFRVCQAYLGKRTYPPADWKNVDSVLAEILGPVFFSMEQHAPFWQHIRFSEPVPTYGDAVPWIDESFAVDTRRLLEPFRLGFRNLQEIWGLVLPPTALFELKKADRLAPEQFHIPDELWARIVYDFALAYRLRTIARDHLLRAMTPLYLGWLASYALQVGTAGAAVDRRLEALCAAYENAKPYLVSRWRWPDRFNP